MVALPVPVFTAEVVAGAVSNRIVIEGELARRADGSKHRVRRPKPPAAPKVKKAPRKRPSPRVRLDRPSKTKYGPRAKRPARWRKDESTRGKPYTKICISMPVAELAILDAFAARVQMSRSDALRKGWRHLAVKALGDAEAGKLFGDPF